HSYIFPEIDSRYKTINRQGQDDREMPLQDPDIFCQQFSFHYRRIQASVSAFSVFDHNKCKASPHYRLCEFHTYILQAEWKMFWHHSIGEKDRAIDHVHAASQKEHYPRCSNQVLLHFLSQLYNEHRHHKSDLLYLL